MLFNTIPFYAAFICFITIYAVLYQKSRTLMILYVTLISTLFFYNANADLALLLPATALVSWTLTHRMNQTEGQLRKRWLAAIIILDLLPLIYFKYTNFGIDVLNTLMQRNFPFMDIVMPVGISFYTFQAISYSVDVYRKRFLLDVDFLEYFFYLSFFPLLLAGPITRAETLIPQLRRHSNIDAHMLNMGLFLIISGIIKKNIIADYIAQYNNWIFNDPLMYSGFENLMGVLGYSLQIYNDFSGYSDMSIGIAALMGFQLRDNFNFPYQSLNITEFWHRWHISLSTWFRDYLYIPLGGNRKGSARTYFNNFLTMVVAGLWHGSTLMYVLWGALHGAALVLHKFCKKLFLDRIGNRWYTRMACWIVFFLFIQVTWVFFRAPDMDIAGKVFSQIFSAFDITYLPVFIKVRPMWTIVVIMALLLHAIRERHYLWLQERFIRLHWAGKFIIMLIVLQLAIQFYTSSVQPFLYYQY